MKSNRIEDDVPRLEELKSHVYGIGASVQADWYTKTTKAIAEYVGRVYGHDMKILVLKGQEAVLEEPEFPADTSNEKEKAIWSKKYDHFLKHEQRYKDYKAKVFTIIMGQCDKAMQNQVETHKEYETVEMDNDVASILKIIKSVATGSNDMKYPSMQALQAWKKLANTRQYDNEELIDWYKRFISVVEVYEEVCDIIAPVKVAEKNPKYKGSAKEGIMSIERDRMLATMFLDGSDRKRYGFLLRQLQNDYSLGSNQYPDDAETALRVLTLYEEQSGKKKKRVRKGDDEELPVSFAQTGLKCFKCGKIGHVKKNCPDKDDQNEEEQKTSNAQVGWAD